MSLLDKAKIRIDQGRPPKYEVGDEDVELVIAYLKEEVKFSQIAQAYGCSKTNGSSIYNRLLRAMQYGVRTGKIKI